MKLKLTAAALAALLLAPVAMPASAQIYINAGLAEFSFRDPNRSPTALLGRVGYDVNPFFAVEGEVAFGIINDNEFDMNSEYGAFVLGKLPLYGDIFHGYLRIGYSMTDASSFDEDGFAFGIGGQYNWGPQGLRLDWTRHDYDASEVDALSFVYAYNF